MALFLSRIFGAVDPEDFWRGEITELGRPIPCTLYIDSELAEDEERLARAAALVDTLAKLDSAARKAIVATFASEKSDREVVRGYVVAQLSEVPPESLDEIFGVDRGEVSPTTFFAKLDLRGVGVHAAKGGFSVVLDYGFDPELSDQLLAVHFDMKGRIVNIGHES